MLFPHNARVSHAENMCNNKVTKGQKTGQRLDRKIGTARAVSIALRHEGVILSVQRKTAKVKIDF